jgi:epoxyqueuosine reductase
MSTTEWVEMSKEVFEKVFEKSPVKRTKFEGLKRNVNFVLGNRVPPELL